MLAKSLVSRLVSRQSQILPTRKLTSLRVGSTISTRLLNTESSNSLIEHWLSSIPSQEWSRQARQASMISPGVCAFLHPHTYISAMTINLKLTFKPISNFHFLIKLTVRPFSVQNIEVSIYNPVVVDYQSELIEDATSTLRKRKTKMNNHKRRKRMKKQRFLLRKLGKI
jgi:hypothetical protein